MKLTIDRSKWFRGKGSQSSMLLRDDGHMCCLGFLGRACGASKKQMLNVSDPSTAHDVSWPRKLCTTNGKLSVIGESLVAINDVDNYYISGLPRETAIAAMMKSVGVHVTFVDSLPKKKPARNRSKK